MPSAIASAKFANNTVNQSIIAIANVYPVGASLIQNKAIIHKIVVIIAEI